MIFFVQGSFALVHMEIIGQFFKTLISPDIKETLLPNIYPSKNKCYFHVFVQKIFLFLLKIIIVCIIKETDATITGNDYAKLSMSKDCNALGRLQPLHESN